MNLFVLISAVVAVAGAVPVNRAGTKAASAYVNYGCQCDSLTFLDKYGNIQGNCKSTDETGARWCYLPLHGYNTCTDVGHGQTSSRFPGRQWSYEACATPPPPAYPQPPVYPLPPVYPQPPVHGYGSPQPPIHPGPGGCLITKDGTGCKDKFGHGIPVHGVYGYGHIPTIETNINGANVNTAIENSNGSETNSNGVENISNGEIESINNTSDVLENNINEFEDNNNNIESTDNSLESNNTEVKDQQNSSNNLESDSYAYGSNIRDYGRVSNGNIANERGASNSRLKFSSADKSKIRFNE